MSERRNMSVNTIYVNKIILPLLTEIVFVNK